MSQLTSSFYTFADVYLLASVSSSRIFLTKMTQAGRPTRQHIVRKIRDEQMVIGLCIANDTQQRPRTLIDRSIGYTSRRLSI